MANYSLYTAQYDPFTYAELLAPIQQATQAQYEQEAALGELGANADLLGSLAEEGSKARERYEQYSKEIEKNIHELASAGLNPSSRAALLALKRKYASDIAPIKTAYDRREEQAKEQRQAMLANPTIMFERDAASTGIDAYIDNPGMNYGNSYLGSLITSQVAGVVKNLKERLREYDASGHIDKYTRIFKQEFGLSPEEVQQAIDVLEQYDLSNPEVINAIFADSKNPLAKIVTSVVESSGIPKWEMNNPDNLKRAFRYGVQGLAEGIGKISVTPMEDYEQKYNFQAWQNELNRKSQKAIADGKLTGPDPVSQIPVNLVPFTISNSDIQENKGVIRKSNRFDKKYQNLFSSKYGHAAPIIPNNSMTIRNKDRGVGLTDFYFTYSDGTLRPLQDILSEVQEDADHPNLAGKVALYYNNLTDDMKAVGITPNEKGLYNVEDFRTKINDNINTPSNYEAKLISLPIGTANNDADKVFLNNILPNFRTNNNNGGVSGIKKITGYSPDSGFKTSDKMTTLTDLTVHIGSSSMSMSEQPKFFGSSEGILMQVGGSLFLIPIKELGSLAEDTYIQDYNNLYNLTENSYDYLSEDPSKYALAVNTAYSNFVNGLLDSLTLSYSDTPFKNR